MDEILVELMVAWEETDGYLISPRMDKALVQLRQEMRGLPKKLDQVSPIAARIGEINKSIRESLDNE